MSAATAPRRAAFEVVRRVFEHDAWADRAFPAAAERHGLDGRERAQAQHLAYGAVQRRGTTDAVAERLSGRRLAKFDPPVRAALRLGLFEVLFSAGADHAAVDAAVELAKGGMRAGGGRRAAGAAGLVNAVLRRAATEREEILASIADDQSPAAAALAHSVPEWLAALWWEELGAGSARSLLRAVNDPHEVALRVNTLRADPATVLAALAAAGEPVRRGEGEELLWPAESLVYDGPLGEAARARLASGELFAQSRAAQAAVALLGARPGERVLDLCAGPGLKTTAIAARMEGTGDLVAVERDEGRAEQIRELADRAGAPGVRIHQADAAEWEPEAPGYDRVLVDPPCSDLGTLASRPDARWRKGPDDVARLAGIQGEILARGIQAMAPGGTLVYSTCTISRAENDEVVRAAGDRPGVTVDDLGAEHPELASTHDSRFLAVRPDRDRTDGFFFARLRRED